MGPDHRILPSIQVLRALAATMVLFQHTQLSVALGFGLPDALPNFWIGSAGVDVFFVISGFIMVVSSWSMFGQRKTGTFLARRWIRLVPLYWAVTLFYVLAAYVLPAIPGVYYPAKMIRAAFLFWPYPMPSGAIQPIHVVGWTLNYEMFFYMLFGLALLLPRRWGIGAAMAALAAIVTAGVLVPPKAIPLVFWSNPIILEFAFGMAVGVAYARGWRVGTGTATALVAASALGFGLHSTAILQGFERLLFWGLPAAALVGAFALARREEIAARAGPIVSLGDASYALYLVHLPVLWALRIAAGKLGLAPATTAGAVLYFAVACAACLAASFLAYSYFEKPVTAFLKTALRHRLPVPALLAFRRRGSIGPSVPVVPLAESPIPARAA